MQRLLIGLCLATCAAAAGCNRQTGPVIAVIPKSTGEAFWNNVEVGVREAGEEEGVRIKWQGPQDETQIAEQNRLIDGMINAGVDGIALAPLDPKAQQAAVQRAVDAGIPVVIFDSGIEGDAHASFVASNNKQGGVMGAEHLQKLLGGNKGTVLLMHFILGTASTEARAQGCLETLKAAGFDSIKEVWGEGANVADCKRAAASAMNILLDHDSKTLELDAIFACNDRATMGVLEALQDLRDNEYEVDVKFVGFDFTPEIIAAVQNGTLDAFVSQNPRKMGYLAVKTTAACVRGETVEPTIDSGIDLVDRDRLENDADIRQRVGLEK